MESGVLSVKSSRRSARNAGSFFYLSAADRSLYAVYEKKDNYLKNFPRNKSNFLRNIKNRQIIIELDLAAAFKFLFLCNVNLNAKGK